MITGKSNDLLKSRFKRGRCVLCGAHTLRAELHHLRYVPEITILLCHACHFRVHYRPTTLSESELVKLLCRVCKPQTLIFYQGRLRELFSRALTHSHSPSHSYEEKSQEQNAKAQDIEHIFKIAPSRREHLKALRLFKERETPPQREASKEAQRA